MPLQNRNQPESSGPDARHVIAASGPRVGLMIFLVLGLAGFGGSLFYCAVMPGARRQDVGTVILTVVMGIALIAGAVAMIYYALHARVVADDAGIWSRGFRDWTFISWEDVTDYYFKKGARGARLGVIESRRDRVLLSYDGWSRVSFLCDAVRQRATRASTQEWKERGETCP